jgi:chromosome segregation ATPase
MKIRTITLKNVRKFQGVTAQISGLADGITTICAPNESGKSTFFDALHAIFFYPHSGQPQEIKSLQPHSKGAVEISVEVEDDLGNPFRIEKRYLASKSASITDLKANRIVAQADEAEQWIKALIGADAHGPAGLLWVKQGISGFGPDGSGTKEKGEREKLREARQTLMSSVAGQIDNVTGGRRMDQIMKACEADLDALATKTGQPKAGGEWGKAVKKVEDLQAEETRLSTQVDELEHALREHAQIKAAHKVSENPQVAAERMEAISKAEKALAEAKGHAQKIDTRKRDLRLCELEAKACSDRLEADKTARHQRSILEISEKTAKKAAEDAEKEASSACSSHEKATQDLADIRARLAKARKALGQAQKAEAQQQKSKQRSELKAILEKVEEFEKEREKHAQVLRDVLITQEDMDSLTRMAQELATAKAVRAAGAATIQLIYDGEVFLSDGEAALPGGEQIPLVKEVDIRIPDVGRMVLSPARSDHQAHNDPDNIAEQIKSLLSELDLEGIEKARAELGRKNEADRSESLARQSITALAPNGIEDLRRTLSDLGDENFEEIEIVADIDVLQKDVSEIEMEEQAALEIQGRIRQEYDAASSLSTEAKTKHTIAKEAVAAPAVKQMTAEEISQGEADLATINQTISETTKDIEGLEKEAPDIETAEALLERLVSSRDNAVTEREQRLERMNTLGGIIRARADDGVETRLEEVRGQLDKARNRSDRYKFEVDSLSELRGHLEASRKEARDAYFEPVKKEIGPLISMLHDDAVLEMDPDTMLPARIVRDGVAEDIDTLSGGAAEQIAILTRLAFARLYARGGKKVPVILDDALVYSDDDRIVKMFTALTRSSKDQQIIVLSCRTRAFEELGGTRAKIEIPTPAS